MALREGPKAAKLAMEVAKIKRSLNVEKKFKDVLIGNVTPVSIGQVNADADGAHVIDITPSITQGSDGTQRVGKSCKLTGFTLKYQILGQEHMVNTRRIRMMLVKGRDVGNNQTPAQVLEALYDVNPLTGLRDLNAPRSYSGMKHHGMSVLRTKTIYLKNKSIDFRSALATHDAAHATGTFTAALQDILRFENGQDSTPEHVKYYVILQCDVGNAHTATDSTLNVPVQLADTGATMQAHLRTWWVDN